MKLMRIKHSMELRNHVSIAVALALFGLILELLASSDNVPNIRFVKAAIYIVQILTISDLYIKLKGNEKI